MTQTYTGWPWLCHRTALKTRHAEAVFKQFLGGADLLLSACAVVLTAVLVLVSHGLSYMALHALEDAQEGQSSMSRGAVLLALACAVILTVSAGGVLVWRF